MKYMTLIYRTSWLLLTLSLMPLAAADEYSKARQGMIQAIEKDVVQTRKYLDRQDFDEAVMKVMATVPRHEFVPEEQREKAYENRPLPIGHGQTISQPYIVALMTDLIETTPEMRVLEIGTGSGYQAAVLAELVDQVYSIEIIRPLGELAAQRLQALGYDNVQARIGDGYYGWKEHAPFDAIVVTAAASHVPPPLIEQLRPGGRMVIPVGSRFMTQQLLFVEKAEDGSVTTRQLMPVFFVPLTGSH
jgi:protein-L-isoaspartate(D-aspartate) O-methyltransferase